MTLYKGIYKKGKTLFKKVFVCCFIVCISVCAMQICTAAQRTCNYAKLQKKDKNTFQKIQKKLDTYSDDDYRYILPLYNRTYTKDSTATWYIGLQSIYDKYDTWLQTDSIVKDSSFDVLEARYLQALSAFYLKNYNTAITLFSYICKQYDTDTKAEESMWYILASHLASGDMEETLFLFDSLQSAFENRPMNNPILFHSVASDIYIETEDWSNALEHLQYLQTCTTTRYIKSRVTFIIGQINELQQKYPTAIDNYRSVIAQKSVVPPLMYSYSLVHASICGKTIESNYKDSLFSAEYERMHPTPDVFEPSVVESAMEERDTFDYPYYFNDAAAVFFLEDEEIIDENTYIDDIYANEYNTEFLDSIFENWDSLSIHIPKTDFSSMTDTTYIVLVDSGYQLPPYNGLVSKFGWRKRRYHYGVDTKNAMYDSIYCLFDGVVRISQRNRSYGNVIIVRHYNGLETFYAHCSKLLVSPNEKVQAGQLIGLVGSTGRSTGPHLHLETRYKGTPINPEFIIDFENKKLHSDTLLICKNTFSLKKTDSKSSSSATTNNHSSNNSGASYYKVRSGDTLSAIAKKHHTSISNIKRLNGLRSDFIREGQRLRVQ